MFPQMTLIRKNLNIIDQLLQQGMHSSDSLLLKARHYYHRSLELYEQANTTQKEADQIYHQAVTLIKEDIE